MSHFPKRWQCCVGLLAMVLVAIAGPAPLVAQVEGEEELAPPAAEVDVDALLADEDAVFAGEGYGYDPGGRRDPFVSLLEARERPALPQGPRPEGVPGLLIGEIDLTGIFVLADGPVAQVQSAQQDRSFLIRVGDGLFDGDVVSISGDEVVFKQVVDDPSALKPFREVVKKLNQ